MRGEIEEREANAREIARQIIDGEIDQRFVGTRRFFLPAIEPARAALFEGELDVVEKRIEPIRVDMQCVDRKIAGLRCLDFEHQAVLPRESHAVKTRRRHLDLGYRIAARDTDYANVVRIERSGQRRDDRPWRDDEIGIDHEENAQERLRAGIDDLDEIDPSERILLAERRESVGAGHGQRVASRLRKRCSPFCRTV